jgi:hydrogenase maturation protease
MTTSKTEQLPLLLLGIGNDSRGDDGLGWHFAERVQERFGDRVAVEFRYQLQVEDAELIRQYKQVVFVDASEKSHEEGFLLQPCEPAASYCYSSHLQSPEAILYLCTNLYHKQPRAWILSICGEDWLLGRTMSATASRNFQAAWEAWEGMFVRNAKMKEVNA